MLNVGPREMHLGHAPPDQARQAAYNRLDFRQLRHILIIAARSFGRSLG